MTSHVFSCRPTLVLATLRSLRFNKILRDGNEWLTGLSSLTSGSLCLVSFSESLTSCLRKPPGRTDRGGCGTVVTIGLFSSFICSLVHWWFRQNKQNRKSLYGLDAVCSPLGMHIRHALHAQLRELNKSDAYVDNVWQMCWKAKEISYSSYQTLYFDQHSNMSSSKLLHRV